MEIVGARAMPLRGKVEDDGPPSQTKFKRKIISFKKRVRSKRGGAY